MCENAELICFGKPEVPFPSHTLYLLHLSRLMSPSIISLSHSPSLSLSIYSLFLSSSLSLFLFFLSLSLSLSLPFLPGNLFLPILFCIFFIHKIDYLFPSLSLTDLTTNPLLQYFGISCTACCTLHRIHCVNLLTWKQHSCYLEVIQT